MKMCPSFRSVFHSHRIAVWLLEFDNSTCPHCRTRLAYRVLEDVEVVLPFKVLRASPTQTISQTRSTMRSVECQTSESPLQAHHQTMISLNGSRIAQLASGSGERSPVSPPWSPVSPYLSSPLVTVSPIITVSFPESSASTSPITPVVNSSDSAPLSRLIPESPLPQILRSDASTPAVPLALTDSNESLDAAARDVWSFITDQLRREGWQIVDPDPALPSPNTALPSFSNAFRTH